jgi:hypothetical protein
MAASLGSPVATYYVGVAASWGDPAAIVFTRNPVPLPVHYRTKIKSALGLLDAKEKIRFAYDCASRVQAFWIQEASTDKSLPAAVKKIENYIGGVEDLSVDDLSEMARQLQLAGDNFDDPEKEIYKSSRLVAAHEALMSVACAIGAIRIARKKELGHPTTEAENLEESCSYVARHAVKARAEHARDSSQERVSDAQWLVEKAEENWQIQRLFNYLLKRVG